MAGLLKPNIHGIGVEASYEIVDSSMSSSTTAQGLFDGVRVNKWDNPSVCYWNEYGQEYLILKINNKCNIYRAGTTSWASACQKFNISKLIDGNFIDVTSSVEQTTSAITDQEWEKTISNLEKGTYKFTIPVGTLRLDSEWYIENIDNVLIMKDDKYYSILDNYYNKIDCVYNEIVDLNRENFIDYQFSTSKLFEEVTIESETFKPIDKFDNFKLISLDENNFELKAIKSKRTLLIAKKSFSTRLAENIDFFELVSEITNNSSIKMTLSIDNGLTWKTWDSVSNSFIDLTNVVPLKEYDTLTEDEKTQWNTFMDEVGVDGINASDLKNIDFNAFETDSMMFAYVFNRNSYEDSCAMSKLQYQFDAYGSYKLLGENDVTVKQGIDNISVIPNKDIELMKVNIGSSGTVNINNGEDIDFPTDEEIDNMVNEVINNVFA